MASLALASSDGPNVRTQLAELRRSRRSEIRARLRILATEIQQLTDEDGKLYAEDLVAGARPMEDA